jgi:hypothetical protein
MHSLTVEGAASHSLYAIQTIACSGYLRIAHSLMRIDTRYQGLLAVSYHIKLSVPYVEVQGCTLRFSHDVTPGVSRSGDMTDSRNGSPDKVPLALMSWYKAALGTWGSVFVTFLRYVNNHPCDH